MSQFSPSFIPVTQKVCRRSGVMDKALHDKLILYRDLEATLDQSIREVSDARTTEDILSAALLVAVLTKAACDVAVGLLGGEALNAGYDVAKLVVEAANGKLDHENAAIYTGGVHVDALEAILVNNGKAAAGQALKRVKVLANVGYDLYKFYNENGKTFLQKSNLEGAKKTALVQLQRVRGEVTRLTAELERCEVIGDPYQAPRTEARRRGA